MFAAGAVLGAALAVPFGIPVELAVCLGYASLFGAATNTLIAPILLGGDIFGFSAAPYLFVSCTAAYIFNFGRSVYVQKPSLRAFMPRRTKKSAFPLPERLYLLLNRVKKKASLSGALSSCAGVFLFFA